MINGEMGRICGNVIRRALSRRAATDPSHCRHLGEASMMSPTTGGVERPSKKLYANIGCEIVKGEGRKSQISVDVS